MADFYTAVENDQKYTDVCDIRKKSNRTNSNVFEAFSVGLECPGKELHEWESSSKQYRDKFKRAKQCVQRRLTTMKRFPARSTANKTSRKKHIYPIQVAYAYGKDCLKKFASKKDQNVFEKSVNGLISKIAESQPNVTNYFNEGSIEKSIQSRSDIDYVRAILDRKYYDDDQLMIIDKMRNVGYNKLNNSDRELFLSIFDEGFSRKNRAVNNLANENLDSDSDSDSDSDEESNKNISTTINYSKAIHANLKKRREALKVQNESINLNTLLQSNKFKITDNEKSKDMIKRLKEVAKLYGDFLLLRTRVFLIEDVYKDAYLKPDRLNTEIADKLTGMSGMVVSKKTLKKEKIDAKYTTKLDMFNKRMRLGDTFVKLQHQQKYKLDEFTPKIQAKLKSGDKDIDKALLSFYNDALPVYLRNIIKKDISTINKDNSEKFKEDKAKLWELYTDKSPIKIVNKEIAEMESEMERNLQQQTVLQRMLDNPIFASRKNVIETTRGRLEDLKRDGGELERKYLAKYREKTEIIEEVLNELNAKYYNPYILLELLNEVIRVETEAKAKTKTT